MLSYRVRTLLISTLITCGVLAGSVLIGQTVSKGPIARFTGTTENVAAPGQAVRIELASWSTDADRDQLVNAWNAPPAPAVTSAPAAAPPADGARGGRGGNRGGGGNRGEEPAPAPIIPGATLGEALRRLPTVGIIWTSESAGYSIRYAYRTAQPDGGERIILATDRRLGAWNAVLKPAGNVAASEYPFSVIELRLNASGAGEGKASITGPLAVDANSKSIALENYASQPMILKGVRRQN